MSLQKRMTALLTITCIMYMSLVSLFHTSLKIHNGQSHARSGHPYNGHDPASEAIYNRTKGRLSLPSNRSGLLLNSNKLPHSKERDYQDSLFESGNASLIKVNSEINSTRKELYEYQNIPTGVLRDRTMNNTKEASQETITRISHFLMDPAITKVSQGVVEFLSLGDLYVYGVFLDKRYPEEKYLRVFVLQPTLKQERHLLCQFYNEHNRSVSVTAKPYEMCENHGRKYGGWIYSCQTPKTDDVELKTVSLLLMKEDRKGFHILSSIPAQTFGTVTSVDFQKVDNQFSDVNIIRHASTMSGKEFLKLPDMKLGVCIPPVYGDNCLSKIVNFIEMCRLLGADNIFLYIHDIPTDTLSFLQNYTSPSAEILNLVIWDLPVVHKNPSTSETNQIIWNRGQLLAIQHCLYTNMAKFDWLLFIDIDEMLVPQTKEAWPDMLSQIQARFNSQFPQKPLAGISFQSAFFQQDFQTQVTNSIDYFQYLHRTRQTSSQRYKMFVKPFLVFELGIHHISKSISDDAGMTTAGLEEGLVHHYRKCIPEDDIHSDLQCEILIKDETILRYEAPLTTVSREVLSAATDFFLRNR